MKSPLRCAHGFAPKRQHDIAGIVTRLLERGCPYAIIGFVITVTVFALNRMFSGWLPTHIIKEVFETMLPTFTDRNPSPAIAMIITVLWVTTATAHIHPRRILWRLLTAWAQAVSRKASAFYTPTRVRLPALYLGHGATDYIAAFTQTFPKLTPCMVSSVIAKHRQASECEADIMTSRELWKHGLLYHESVER